MGGPIQISSLYSRQKCQFSLLNIGWNIKLFSETRSLNDLLQSTNTMFVISSKPNLNFVLIRPKKN